MSNSSFELQVPGVNRKSVECRFNGGHITSHSGLLLLAQADRNLIQLNLICLLTSLVCWQMDGVC